jgi:peptidyl-prolyl cis-trans isomerase D
MLLSLMRKHAQSWIIKFMIALIAVVFIFYFGYSFHSDERLKVAEINGEPISRVQYERAYRNIVSNYQNQYKSMWSDNLIEVFDLKNKALEALIEQKILIQEAERLGLMVTKNEIREKILNNPNFFMDGRFNESRYRSVLSSYFHISPEAYEEDLSKNLLHQKLVQFLTTFLVPSDQDILDHYRYINEKIKLSFVKFSPDEYKSSVEKDKESVKAFFEERKENYRKPEKIKIGYIEISPKQFKDKVELDEDLLTGYYESNISIFTQEKQVKASHILFKVADDASPEDQKKVEEKAASVLEKAKKGEDFAELAKQFSDDTTKSKGGDLGYYTESQMLKDFKDKEFADAVFSLNKGAISDLVKTDYGYNIIKVEDIRDESVKPYPEVREQIENTMRQNSSMDMAKSRALDLIDQMPYEIDLKEYASDHGVPYSSTDFFSESELIPVIRGNSKLKETLFAFQKGDITEVVDLNDSYFIIQVIDKKDSYLPELDEVYVSAEVDFIDHMALESAKAEAEKYLQALKEDGKWEELAKEKNKAVESTDFFARRGTPRKIGAVSGLQEAVFKLNADNLFPDRIFDNNKGAIVVKWEAKQDIDQEKYKEEKERYTESVTQMKQSEVFSDWIEKMKAKSDIDRSYFEKYK